MNEFRRHAWYEYGIVYVNGVHKTGSALDRRFYFPPKPNKPGCNESQGV